MRAALFGLALMVGLQATARAQAAAPEVTLSVVARAPTYTWNPVHPDDLQIGFTARIKNVSSHPVTVCSDSEFAIHARSVKRGDRAVEPHRGSIDWLLYPPPGPFKTLKPGEMLLISFAGLDSTFRYNTVVRYPLPGVGRYTAIFEYDCPDDEIVGTVIAAPTSFRIAPPPPPPIRLEIEARRPTVQWVHAVATSSSRAFDQLSFLVRIKNISKKLVLVCVDPYHSIHPIRVLREGKALADLGGYETADFKRGVLFPRLKVAGLEPGRTLKRRVDGLRSEEILYVVSAQTHGFIDAGKGHYRVQFEYRCGDAGAYAGPLTSNWVSFEVN